MAGFTEFNGSEWCQINRLCIDVPSLFNRAGTGLVPALLRFLCWGVSTMSGLRPDHFTNSYGMTLGSWEAWPGLSDGHWELRVLLPATWGWQLCQQMCGECAFGWTSLDASGLFLRKQKTILAGRFTWKGGNGLHTDKRPWHNRFIYSNFSRL